MVLQNAWFVELKFYHMYDEIIPALKTSKVLKILSPEKDNISDLPAIDSYVSFLPFVNFLKDKEVTTTGIRADFYRHLIGKFESDPNLLKRVNNIRELNDHKELLEIISTAIFPIICDEGENNFTLSAPYKLNIFAYSETFKNLFIDRSESSLILPEEITEEKLRQVHCTMIYAHVLEKYYGIKLNENPELIFPVKDTKTGMKRYFKMRYDRRFIDLLTKDKLPLIQDCAVCLNTFRILDLETQLKTMPLNLFEAEGFAVWIAEDVTTSESLDRIKKILLRNENDAEDIKELKEAILILIGLHDLEIGLMPFVSVNNNFVLNEENTCHSLVGKSWKANDVQSLKEFHYLLDFQKDNPKPLAVTNLDENLLNEQPLLKPLHNDGARSYIYFPLQNSEGVLGMLELSSSTLHYLTQEVIDRLEPAIPLLSLAMFKSRDAFNNRIEKLVKEKFTALQPSVEWKFSEVAWAYLKLKEPSAETGKIIFENVYPLYGAIDIRNSSNERGYAIQQDMKTQLHLIDETLDKLQATIPLTLLEGLKFKNHTFQQAIENVLLPEDEEHINNFLTNEVTPVFTHLQKSNSTILSIIEHYFELEKNCDGPLYNFRNDYEETMGSINHSISQYLDEQDELLQRSFPHYFEKYKTDGVEYNIYIGQSIAPDHLFDLLYLKNVRLWQLQSMAELAKITYKLLPGFKVKLETTQLILIHNQPISISFRKDERRFDVEGSYNIRYEIMKKRIDKAYIKNTTERLTQPGKIAMVYSNLKEAQEYEENIQFLQSKGLLKRGYEHFDLEDLQGLKGLRALRVDINLD